MRAVLGVMLFIYSMVGFGEGEAMAETLSISAQSGQNTAVRRHAFWNSDCSSQNFKIIVLSAPKNGRVTTSPGSQKIEGARVGTVGTCSGKTVSAQFVNYRSTPGFKGTDTFKYRVAGRTRSFENTVRVRVQ